MNVFARHRWESLLALLVAAAALTAALLSPLYWNAEQILYSLQQSTAVAGIVALGFALVILLGEIDVSIPAIVAIGTVSLGRLSAADVPLAAALPVVLALGTAAGACNGLLIARFQVSSLALTLGSLAVFRALALLIGGREGYASDAFQPAYLWLGSATVLEIVPVSLLLLLLLAGLLTFVLRRTALGRLLIATGCNRTATRYSGHNSGVLIVIAYGIAGALAGLAALVFVGQYESARADNAGQILLLVVAAVVLGGFEISGGKGRVSGLLLSLLLLGTLQNGMGLANVSGPVQTLVVGSVLVLAVLAPVFWRALRSAPLTKSRPEAVRTAQGSSSPGPPPNQPLLELRGVSKTFGGIRALSGVNLEIRPGTIHALVGENGAGKSTLIKIITGIHTADAGQIYWGGSAMKFDSPEAARRAGVVAVYQDPDLFPALSVAENIFMGIQPRTALGTISRRAMNRRSSELLKELGAPLDPQILVSGLSVGQMQFVEFARALAGGSPRLFILDEPTASLSPQEAERLFVLLRRLRDQGVAVLLISHRLEELEGLVDTITVIRDGAHVATRPAAELSRTDIVRLMVGRELESVPRQDRRPAQLGTPVLEVRDLGISGIFDGVSFRVHAGEVVAMAGLVGSGRTEIADAIFGITPPQFGTISMKGNELHAASPSRMVHMGTGYVPEDREKKGVIAQLSIGENISLACLGDIARWGVIQPALQQGLAERYVSRLSIRPGHTGMPVVDLSGGNRQKVVLAKWLATAPSLLILDEPTHGIDVAAKAQLHELIEGLRRDGVGILLISSDLPEILRLGDRILAIAEGRIVAEFDRSAATQEGIMMACCSEVTRVPGEAQC